MSARCRAMSPWVSFADRETAGSCLTDGASRRAACRGASLPRTTPRMCRSRLPAPTVTWMSHAEGRSIVEMRTTPLHGEQNAADRGDGAARALAHRSSRGGTGEKRGTSSQKVIGKADHDSSRHCRECGESNRPANDGGSSLPTT
jgi:hypothetical protein